MTDELLTLAEAAEKEIGSEDELFTVEQLLHNRVPVECLCGVYVLFNDTEPVYVGQSTNVTSRVALHAKEAYKEFDSYAVVECEAQFLDYLEAKYILALLPKYNGMLPFSRYALIAGAITREDLAATPLEDLENAAAVVGKLMQQAEDDERQDRR